LDNFFATFLVVWRETFEAFLIIFLLSTRLVKENLWLASKRFVSLGIISGIALSVLAAIALFKIEDMGESFVGTNLRWFLPIIASFMMVHMVFWMAKHGKEISGEIKTMVEGEKGKTFFWGITLFIAYAVAREGFETVIFLYGLSLKATTQGQSFSFLIPALLGFCISLLTVYILKKGLSYFNMKYFFIITNFFLIGTALSLFVTGLNELIDLDYVPTFKTPLWDTSSIIPSDSVLGKTLNMLLGYIPQPSTTLVVCYLAFVVVILGLYLKNRTSPKNASIK